MRKSLILGYFVVLFAACGNNDVNSDRAMYKAAYNVFQDYVIEYRIDSTLFESPVIEDWQDSLKSYKWLSTNSEGDTLGVQVLVKKRHGLKPEMILIGDKDAWLTFLREHDPNTRIQKKDVPPM